MLNYYDPFDNALFKTEPSSPLSRLFPQSRTYHRSRRRLDIQTPDGSFVAQIEHTIVITKTNRSFNTA
ncbi:hypothetical protein PO124_34365 [Bacillus licheniformis]|nr:hypothetical protein [Bacillus licheniformis]